MSVCAVGFVDGQYNKAAERLQYTNTATPQHCCLLCCFGCRKKEALARKHMRAIEAAKQAAADERTAWRAAVTEKLKRQATEREDKLRAELLKQRDEQLEVSTAACACWLVYMMHRLATTPVSQLPQLCH
jgi:Sec-independent protein translocase protein TatA